MRIAMLVGVAVVAAGLNAQGTTLELITEGGGQGSVIALLEPGEAAQDIQLGTAMVRDDPAAQRTSCEPNCLLPGYYFPPPDLPPVPEPTVLALLGVGIGLLAVRRTRSPSSRLAA